jgi:hypothetical protein
VDALAQRITLGQQSHQTLRESLNDRDLQSEPRVLDAGGKRFAVAQQRAGARRQLVDASEQARGRVTSAEFVHARAGFGEGVKGNVDAVELTVILSAILQVIDDLQRRAERIIGAPGGTALTVNVQHETPHRHGGIRAITDQIVPVAVTQLGHIHSKRGEQILRVTRRELACRELRAQSDADRIVVAFAKQGRFEPIDQRKLFLRRKRGMVGDIVGGTHEFIECEDRRPMARVNQP